MPKAGAYLEEGSIVYLYTSEEEERKKVVVPDLKNKSVSEATNELKNLNLNFVVDGSGSVILQSITAGTETQAGTVISITAKENASGGQ